MKTTCTDFHDFIVEKKMLSKTMELEYLISKRKSGFLPHVHPHVELIYVIEGEISMAIDSQIYHVKAGHLVCIPHGVLHNTTTQQEAQIYRRLLIKLNPVYIRQLLLYAHCNPEHFQFLQKGFVVSPEVLEEHHLLEMMDGLYRSGESDDLYHGSESDCYLLLMMMLLRKIVEGKQTVIASGSSFFMVTRIIEYIRQSIKDPEFGIDDILHQFAISKAHLNRVFRQYTNMSVHQYLIQLRMDLARQEIIQGKNMYEACFDNGYRNYSSFLKAFKRTYGITPSKLKN